MTGATTPPSPAESPAAALLLTAEVLSQPSAAGVAFLRRMQAAGVALASPLPARALERFELETGIAIRAFPAQATVTPKAVLATVKSLGADGARSWLITHDPADIPAAETAGLGGVVVIGPATADDGQGILVRHATALADVPRVLMPRDGGCWHQR